MRRGQHGVRCAVLCSAKNIFGSNTYCPKLSWLLTIMLHVRKTTSVKWEVAKNWMCHVQSRWNRRLEDQATATRSWCWHLERYSRDFHIRVLRVNEDEEEESKMTTIMDLMTSLGYKNATAEIENARCTGKKQNNKPRPIIIKLYSRPFRISLLQAAKSADGRTILQGVQIVEDFTPSDFSAARKHFHLWNKLMTKVKEYESLEENSSLMEE